MPHGLVLTIPNNLGAPLYPGAILPDSEVVQSPTTVDLDIQAYIDQADGYLSDYGEQVTGGWLTGAQIIERVATESSVNARFSAGLAGISLRMGRWDDRRTPRTMIIPLGFMYPSGLVYTASW